MTEPIQTQLEEDVTYHSPEPSVRADCLFELLSLLFPAAAEANVEGNVEGMVILWRWRCKC